MVKYAYLLTGGAIGTLARYIVSTYFSSSGFPVGTFIVNLSGSFIIGLIAGAGAERMNSNWRLFTITGVLGGYTTFSAFTLESVELFRNEHLFTGLMYVSGSCILGITAAAAGFFTGQFIAQKFYYN
jgi:fluoride exporter